MIYEIKIKDLKRRIVLKLIREGIVKASEAIDPEKVVAAWYVTEPYQQSSSVDLVY